MICGFNMNLYCDNAATTFPKPESVYRSVENAMRNIGASPGRGGYRRSLDAARLLFSTRESIASLFAIADASRVIMTHNATGALNLALRGVLKSGDHVVTTTMEHNSLIRPLELLSQSAVDYTMVHASSSGFADPDEIKKAITSKTKMIAISHVSNVCGLIQPVEEIGRIAKENDILFLLDAAQSAGSIPIDVKALSVDLLAAPGHKGLYGPQGTGFLYVGNNISLQPFMAGGTGTNSTERDQPLVIPDGFEPGTHNLPGIAGFKAGIDFVTEVGVDTIGRHERELVSQLAESLRMCSAITLHGYADSDHNNGVLSITIKDADSAAIAFLLDQKYDISVRSGLHCAPDAHKTLGTFPAGTLRLSPGWFNTAEDVAFVADAIIKCIT